MTFLTPGYLWLLLAVAGLAGLYLVLQRRRRHYAVRFTNVDLLSTVAPRRPGWRRHLPAAGVALGLVALVLALARPVRDEKVPRDDATVVLVIDVSASMEATDVEPSRLTAAQLAATEFVESLPDGFQVGLVAYDATASVLSPPTLDRAAVLAAISTLTTGPGTASGDAIDTALGSLASTLVSEDAAAAGDEADEAAVATIVLLSDGVTSVGQPVEEAAATAAEQGVPVTTIAYGTSSGSVVVDGQTVPVPADPAAMEAIAAATGGRSYEAASAEELASVYDSIQSRVGYDLEQREILRWFVGVGVVALLAAVAASMLWTARFL